MFGGSPRTALASPLLKAGWNEPPTQPETAMSSPAVLLDEPIEPSAPPAPAPSTARPAPTLQEIYDLYGGQVFRRARMLLRDPDRARDATQEVFLRAVQDPGGVRAHPLPWLFRVTRNLCLNNLRDNRRRVQLLAGRSPDFRIDDRADARVVVSEVLARVPADLQEIAIYYYLDDLSHEDIAAIVGVSRRTIGNRLAAFQALVAELLVNEGNA
jgi:RNA polymerase sigma-70 factor (ECF subfamily)